MKWDRLENGNLLTAAESAGFDVLITCDQNLRYQQNLSGRRLAIIEITTNKRAAIIPYCEQIAELVADGIAGEDLVARGVATSKLDRSFNRSVTFRVVGSF